MKTVLCIGGSDPTGGAGIAADMRTCASLGVHGACVVTAVTAQSPSRVVSRGDVAAAQVGAQLESLENFEMAAVKIGMLPTPDVVDRVADWLERHATLPVVFDPVLVSSSGGRLCDDDAVERMVPRLFGLVELLTPNHPELEALVGHSVAAAEDALVEAASALRAHGADAVLLKGGHREGDEVIDWLVRPGDREAMAHERVGGLPPRGTGCALSTAIAAFRARGCDLPTSVRQASDHVHAAIADAYLVGGAPMGVPHLFWEFYGSEGLP